jgi:CRISPR/Cas system-associated exonuclease Cas4 (RecB family)
VLCRASAALPHAYYESPWTDRGSVIHQFLQGVSQVGRDAALELVGPDYRSACTQLVLDGLEEQLSLAAEVSFAYDFEQDSARELGRGAGRQYRDVKESELPTTLDVVGVKRVPAGNRGLYVEFKTGWTTRRRPAQVMQLDVGALCVARAFGCDVVEVQLIHVYEGMEPHVERRIIDGWEIDAFASLARDVYREALAIREKMQAGIMPTEYSTGPWCESCGARQFCPAQAQMIRALLSGDWFDGPRRLSPIPDDVLIALYDEIKGAQSVLSFLKGKVLGLASQRTLKLGKTADGKQRWLGKVYSEGNEYLDGDITYDVIEELLGADAATAATEVTTSKKLIKEALKGRVPPRQGAKTEREILTRIRAKHGSKRKWSDDVKEYTTKPGELPSGDEPPEDIK